MIIEDQILTLEEERMYFWEILQSEATDPTGLMRKYLRAFSDKEITRMNKPIRDEELEPGEDE